jgi:hypothetical protein
LKALTKTVIETALEGRGRALDVDLIAEAGATFPRSQPNRLDRQVLDLASGRR